MEEPGQRLRRERERLNLRYRDVELASQTIANRHGNDEFIIALSRLADIENKGTVPSLYRFYSLCAIYRLDWKEVLRWFSIPLDDLILDSSQIDVEETHLVGFESSEGADLIVPAAFAKDVDWLETGYLGRSLEEWGRFPVESLQHLELGKFRYGFIGSEDWSMYPMLAPGSFIQIDESKRKIAADGWTDEFDRPIYFLEHRSRYFCSWCCEAANSLILLPHPSSHRPADVFRYPAEVEVIGQVVGVAKRLDLAKRRRIHS
jgi:transcriptional regulator with XRE-family HTH domain